MITGADALGIICVILLLAVSIAEFKNSNYTQDSNEDNNEIDDE